MYGLKMVALIKRHLEVELEVAELKMLSFFTGSDQDRHEKRKWNYKWILCHSLGCPISLCSSYFEWNSNSNFIYFIKAGIGPIWPISPGLGEVYSHVGAVLDVIKLCVEGKIDPNGDAQTGET